jgi:hypothetical protein
LQILHGLDVLVLLLPPLARDVDHTDLLALVDEQRASQGGVQHAAQFAGFGAVGRVVGSQPGDDPGLVVVLKTTTQRQTQSPNASPALDSD